MLSIEELTTLFEASPLWYVVGIVSVINITITVIEMIVDYFSDTPRLWKDMKKCRSMKDKMKIVF